MSQDYLKEKKITLSLRSIFDIGVIASICYIGFTVNTLKDEMNGIVSLIEATSEEATKKIEQMDITYSVDDPALDARKSGYKDVLFDVGQVGALRVTERIKNAFGKNVKIVVKPDPSNSFYIAKIGGKEFMVSADGGYLIVDDVYIPLDEKEYEKFKRSENFSKLENKNVSLDSNNLESAPIIEKQVSNSEVSTKDQQQIDKLSTYYPNKLPGLSISHDTYSERLDVFQQAKKQSIKFEAIEPIKELFVFFDVSCPSCKKFFNSIPVYQEKGITINLMLIDKTRKYTSDKAKQMMSIYCETDQKGKLIELLSGDYTEQNDCGYGKKYIESMTNAALLVGTIGTPSIFTEDAIPIYGYDDSKNKYYPIYKYSSVTNWLERNGLI